MFEVKLYNMLFFEALLVIFEAFLEELSSEYEFKPKNLYNIQKLIDGLMPILKSYEKGTKKR